MLFGIKIVGVSRQDSISISFIVFYPGKLLSSGGLVIIELYADKMAFKRYYIDFS